MTTMKSPDNKALELALVDRCREMGCQTDALPLPEAVKDYFRHPEPIEAWLQGEIVFQMHNPGKS